jgi:hypothetical protein
MRFEPGTSRIESRRVAGWARLFGMILQQILRSSPYFVYGEFKPFCTRTEPGCCRGQPFRIEINDSLLRYILIYLCFLLRNWLPIQNHPAVYFSMMHGLCNCRCQRTGTKTGTSHSIAFTCEKAAMNFKKKFNAATFTIQFAMTRSRW